MQHLRVRNRLAGRKGSGEARETSIFAMSEMVIQVAPARSPAIVIALEK
jgi:hypothetical protein